MQEESLHVQGFIPARRLYRAAEPIYVTFPKDPAGGHCPCALWLASPSKMHEAGVARACAGLPRALPRMEETDLIVAWDEVKAAALKSHVLPPFLSCTAEDGRSVLSAPMLGKNLAHCSVTGDVMAAVRIVRDVAIGLGHCHAQGIAHLAVKPQNIILDGSSGAALLWSFASAARVSRASAGPGMPFEGAAVYMAPEQTGRQATQPDFRSDLYSLGVVLYELVAGLPPFGAGRPAEELAHCHLAVRPHPLSHHLPLVVCRVIQKLLKKDQDLRYSSARSLVDDLDVILGAHAAGLDSLVLDTPRQPMALQPLAFLFECSDVLNTLQSAVADARACKLARSRLILLSGDSGSGKSTLMMAAHQRMRGSQVVCMGRYLQYDRRPYGAIATCFRQMIDQTRMMPSPARENAYMVLNASEMMMTHAMQLASICPEFLAHAKEITGSTPEALPECSRQENRARFHAAFLYVFRFFYEEVGVPLIMFLDDLQWADDCSLSFLETVLLQGDGPFLLIGSYRPDAAPEGSPLAETLARMRSCTDVCQVEELKLAAWSESTVQEVVRTMLLGQSKGRAANHQDVRPLASYVRKVAGGNPFLTLQLMYRLAENRQLKYVWEQRQWDWSELGASEPEAVPARQLLRSWMVSLEPATQQVLGNLALAGFHMDVGLFTSFMTGVLGEGATVLHALRDAVRHGAVVLKGVLSDPTSLIAFAHDSFEEVALELMPEERRMAGRLQLAAAIARRLDVPVLGTLGQEQEDAAMVPPMDYVQEVQLPADHSLAFAVVANFVQVADTLTDPDAIAVLARLCAAVGAHCFSVAAYEMAAKAYSDSIRLEASLLPSAFPWYKTSEPKRSRIWQLHFDCAVALQEAKQLVAADEMLALCQQHAISSVEGVRARLERSFLANLEQRHEDAIYISLEAAALLGVSIDPKPPMDYVQQYVKERILLPMEEARKRGRPLVSVIPLMQHNQVSTLLDSMLESVVSPAFFGSNMGLYTFVAAHAVAMAIERGFSSHGTFLAMGILGFAMGSLLSLTVEGAVVAIDGGIHLYNDMNPSQLCEINCLRYMHAALAGLWRSDVALCLEWFDRSFEEGHRKGQIVYCNYARVFHIWYALATGVNLYRILQLASKRFMFVRQSGRQDAVVSFMAVQYAAGIMAGGLDEPSRASVAKLEEASKSHPSYARAAVCTFLMLAYHVIGDHKEAMRLFSLLTPSVLQRSEGMLPHYEYHWIAPLLCAHALTQLPSALARRQSPLWATMVGCERKLSQWKEISFAHWGAKHCLVRATYVALLHLDDRNAASPLSDFEQTVGEADKMHQPLVAALACLGAAAWCKLQGPSQDSVRSGFLGGSVRWFRELGARVPLARIAADADALPMEAEGVGSSPLRSSGSEMPYGRMLTSLGPMGAAKEVVAIARAVRALSAKTEVVDVCASFLDALEEFAGAHYIVLVLQREEGSRSETAGGFGGRLLQEFHVAAVKSNSVSSMDSQALSSRALPLSLLRLCHSSEVPVVISDAASDHRLKPGAELEDEYYTRKVVCSALIVPIPSHTGPCGFVYAENNHAAGVFHETSCQVVSLLTAQLATSLATASGFKSLVERVGGMEETNRQLLAANDRLRRFVPEPFLSAVCKDTSLVGRPGDVVERPVFVLAMHFGHAAAPDDDRHRIGFLNYFLNAAVPIIKAQRGILGSELGDVTHAVFSDAQQAVGAAATVIAAIARLNTSANGGKAERQWPALKVSLAIHYGDVMLGFIGTEQHLVAATFGAAVRQVDEIAQSSKSPPNAVVITGQALELVKEGMVDVQGKEEWTLPEGAVTLTIATITAPRFSTL